MRAKLHKGYFKYSNQLGYFILDNASNNDTALEELARSISFDPEKKGLRCEGHMINLAVEAFLYGTHPSDFNKKLEEEKLETSRLKLWRERGPVGKPYNPRASYTVQCVQ